MSNLTGTDKSVILLMTIGEDRAAEVFKHLSQREVQTLSAAMANVTQISNKQLPMCWRSLSKKLNSLPH